jgi:phosphohistidine phosphatase SixA
MGWRENGHASFRTCGARAARTVLKAKSAVGFRQMIQRLTNCCLKLVLLGMVMTGSSQATASELSDLLKTSDHVLLMRHALAPGVGDPAGYKLQDCKSQRNLDAKGREQAQKTGQWLKAQGVGSALVYSSAWCRCKETAEKLAVGPTVLEPSLNSFFDDMRQGPQSNLNLQKFIGSQLKTKGDKALILVTHHVNIAEFTGENIGSGDMVLAKVNAAGKMVSFKIYPSPY